MKDVIARTLRADAGDDAADGEAAQERVGGSVLQWVLPQPVPA
jgi:hypothetical protein